MTDEIDDTNPGGTVLLRYYAAGELEPVEPARYLVWFEDDTPMLARWTGYQWLTADDFEGDITNEVYFWATIPPLASLEANYGKSV